VAVPRAGRPPGVSNGARWLRYGRPGWTSRSSARTFPG